MNARTLFACLLVMGAACARTPASGGTAEDSARDSATGQGAGGQRTGGTGATQADVERLEREARALAKAEGCAEAAQCRTAPVGSRPCGGPREYLVYCPLTTDSAALFRKLGELEAAEKAFNEQSGLMSTCEFRMPPATALTGGRCVTAPAR